MCGFVTVSTGSGPPLQFTDLEAMTDAVAHRGPDDVGYVWVSPDGQLHVGRGGFGDEPRRGVLIGHRRLSILDLSAAAHQPFVDTSRTSCLAFNGAIYNYVELRAELRSHGVTFRSSGDTEVALASYQRWGEDAFRRFNGMWACTIWDGRENKLVISRDRFGIKPLYYGRVRNTWVFASEIKSIIRYPGLDRALAHDQVLEYLQAGLIDHTDRTFFENVYSVPPGTTITLKNGHAQVSQFWSLPEKRGQQRDVVAGCRELLQDSVRLRSRSDVPLGTMLSGGLDSTSIAALIVSQARLGGSTGSERRGLKSFHDTFTACWPDDVTVDEESEVDQFCDALGITSRKSYLTAEQIGELLSEVTFQLDFPFENPVPVVQYILMRRARERGIKVVLNGHGSDELFGGYPGAFVNPFLAGLLLRGAWSDYRREKQNFAEWYDQTATYTELMWGLTPRLLRPVVGRMAKKSHDCQNGLFEKMDDAPWSRVDAEWQVSRRLHPLEGALWRNFRAAILPAWLRMEDRVSMAHGVEARVPFLDHRLVEFAFGLGDEWKLQDGLTKYILRRAMRDLLPRSIVEDRRKRRFATPYARWLRGPWRPLLVDHLLMGQPRIRTYLKVPLLRRRLIEFLDGSDSVSASVVWRALQTEIWLRRFT